MTKKHWGILSENVSKLSKHLAALQNILRPDSEESGQAMEEDPGC